MQLFVLICNGSQAYGAHMQQFALMCNNVQRLAPIRAAHMQQFALFCSDSQRFQPSATICNDLQAYAAHYLQTFAARMQKIVLICNGALRFASICSAFATICFDSQRFARICERAYAAHMQ